jgi:probable HAF family extracellular repeat protein
MWLAPRLYRDTMRSKIVTGITSVILFGWLALAVRLSAQEPDKPAHYRVFNLGTLGGTVSAGNTINNRGVAMGSANLPGDTTAHATAWLFGLKFDLGTLGGPNSNVVFPNRNDLGEIVGISETAAIDPLGEQWSCSAFFPTITGHICLGFVWQWDEMKALPTLGGNNGFAAAVNNRGQVVGWAENTVHDSTCVSPQVLQFEAVIWGSPNGQIQELHPLHGDPDSAATAINQNGQVVGISGTCDVAVGAFSAKHALLWEDGRVTNLPTLGGAGWNTPAAINNQGEIAGFSDLPGDVKSGVLTPNFHAVLWTKEHVIHDLGTLPGDSLSEATGINDRGQIVGVSFPSSHAFIWQDGVMTDLNKLIPSGSPLALISTGDIDDRGEITGQACVVSNGVCTSETPAFLAIPDCDGDAPDAVSSEAQTGAEVPETVRQQLMHRLAFGRFAAAPVSAQGVLCPLCAF